MDGFKTRPSSSGRARSRWLARRFGQELRIARLSVGLTQATVARLAGISQQEVSRTELGDLDVSLDIRCRVAAAVGHETSLGIHPVATVRLRDSGQLGLARAILVELHPTWSGQFEVPTGPGELHAADMVLARADELVHVEIERALVDFQAQLRRALVKRNSLAGRHQRPVRLVLAIGDTHANRMRLADARGVVEQALPVPPRAVWAALRGGVPVGGDGLIFVRPRFPDTTVGSRRT